MTWLEIWNLNRPHSSVVDLARSALKDYAGLVKELEAELSSRQVVRALFAMRSACGASQAEIASQLSCSQSRVSKIENGVDADLRIGELEVYANALDCDITADDRAARLVIDRFALPVAAQPSPQ